MKTFITDDFLLQSNIAQKLYHDYAKDMPIIDYHCHLNPAEIAQNNSYRSITQMWLEGDHYKWRAMRSAGIKEEDITGHIGDASYDKSRFMDYAKILPQTIGNPLYHWTHLELLRYFNVETLLNSNTAEQIYMQTNKIINDSAFRPQTIIKRFKVEYIGTTDDPIDKLEHHQAIAKQNINSTVAPSWRPDKIVKINLTGFADYINKLASISEIHIKNIDDLLAAIIKRLQFFANNGCSISDHGYDDFIFTRNIDKTKANVALQKALKNETLSDDEILHYKSFIMLELGKDYGKMGWVMQLHIGALRNNNTKIFSKLGADVGFDSINDSNYAPALSNYLDSLEILGLLPKTILYSLNPRDNEMLGTMIGNFQGSGIAGKIQFGSAWWFNDQKDGMERQMIALSSLGLLSRFVGMLTDSRSILSYSRHEYFRRILCNILGEWVTKGEAPNDIDLLGKMVQDICYNNAKNYFNTK